MAANLCAIGGGTWTMASCETALLLCSGNADVAREMLLGGMIELTPEATIAKLVQCVTHIACVLEMLHERCIG